MDSAAVVSLYSWRAQIDEHTILFILQCTEDHNFESFATASGSSLTSFETGHQPSCNVIASSHIMEPSFTSVPEVPMASIPSFPALQTVHCSLTPIHTCVVVAGQFTSILTYALWLQIFSGCHIHRLHSFNWHSVTQQAASLTRSNLKQYLIPHHYFASVGVIQSKFSAICFGMLKHQ